MRFTKIFYSLGVTALLAFCSVAHAEVYDFSGSSVSFNDKKLIDSLEHNAPIKLNGDSSGGFHGGERVKVDDYKVKVKPSHEYAQITSPVPEPETYAMMLVGLVLIGFTARRRSK